MAILGELVVCMFVYCRACLMELLHTNRQLCICIYVVAQMNPNMPQHSLEEILKNDTVRKRFGLPKNYDVEKANDLMKQSPEDVVKMISFREYLLANASSSPSEVPPRFKVAPATPPTDEEDDSWGKWKGHEDPPMTRRMQSPNLPGGNYPNGRPPGMPAMMPERQDTRVGKNAKGKGKGDKGKIVGKNAKDKAQGRDRSREKKGNGKGKIGEAKTRVLQMTEKRIEKKLAEHRAELDRRQKEDEEAEEHKKRKREARFNKQDEKRNESLPSEMPTEVEDESNLARYARKRASETSRPMFTGDIPPILTSAGRASILIIIHIVGLCLAV